jgi:hypothetical protein
MIPSELRTHANRRRRATRRLLAAVFVGTLATASTATAQPDPRKDAKVHLGPFYLTPVFHVKDFGVDSNVFNEGDRPQSDFTVTVAPEVNIWVPFGRRALVSSTVVPSYIYFAQHSHERSANLNGSLKTELFLRRVTLAAEGAWINSRQRPNIEIDARSRRVEASAGVSAHVKVSRKLTLSLSTRQAEADFDGDAVFDGTNLRESLASRARTAGASLQFRLTPLTSVAIVGDYSETDFRFAPIRDSRSDRAMASVTFQPRALVSGTAEVGYRRFRTLSEAVPDYSGVIGRAALGYSRGGAIAVRVTMERDVSYSYESLQPFYLVNMAGVDLRRQLRGRLDVVAGFQRHALNYRNIVRDDDLNLLPPRKDTTRAVSAGIGFHFSRETLVDLVASYWTRESNTRLSRAYDGYRLGAIVTVGSER